MNQYNPSVTAQIPGVSIHCLPLLAQTIAQVAVWPVFDKHVQHGSFNHRIDIYPITIKEFSGNYQTGVTDRQFYTLRLKL
ncbi:MAG: hypothetical protein LRY61_11920 [Burkholderiaceae bacterium]|nr:hypothetical protein [Burkholderiaceae bacterium]MCD8517944.1 hypothetical protein [Burkholderiaceae bacterium]